LLWEASSNRPQPTNTNRPQLDRALPSKRTSSSTTKAGSSSTKERQKRRRQNNHRVVVGSNRLRGKVTYDDPGPSDQRITLLSRKATLIQLHSKSQLSKTGFNDMHRRRVEGRRHHKTDSMSQNHCCRCRCSLSVCRLRVLRLTKRRSSYASAYLALGKPFGNPKDRMTDKSSYLAGPY